MKSPETRQLAEGVYAYVQPDGGWCVSNAGIIVGDEATVLVDTAATERRTRLLAEQVARVSPQPPDVLINTHFHGDHVFGNSVFSPRATIVAHELTRVEMLEAGHGLRNLWPDVDWGDTPITPPTITFRDAITVFAGQLRLEVIHVGPAHTTNDSVIWVPDKRILFAGDVLMSGVTPFCLMGSLAGSLRAIDRLRALDPEIIVPGHGHVGGKELLEQNESYLLWLQQLATDGVRSGLSVLDLAAESPLGEFAELLDPERLVGNLHRAYAEQMGQPLGAPLDVLKAFQDMVAHHGRLPDCHA
ncbi:MAG TPA: MBL fold metallo-hydrolase [Candidatus Limnocylindrales bacterium]|nr:MBL fold metallo-hydrolase [Candidatus Limnocylindrales bacterium]